MSLYPWFSRAYLYWLYGLLYDDNGHFAISGVGMSPVPMAENVKFEETESFTSFVEAEDWYKTISEALNHYLKS